MHVGLGNFREVDVEDLTKHKMDYEHNYVTPETVKIVNDAKDEKHKICAVGTTVVRTLETCVTTRGRLAEYSGWTNKFIFPPYDFSVPDAFISNFHLPYSTLLMMVVAFGGYEYVPTELNKRDQELLVTKHNEAIKVLPHLYDQNNSLTSYLHYAF